MPWYLTDYRANWRRQDDFEEAGAPGAYGGHIWARGPHEAEIFAKLRGMGERVISQGVRRRRPPYKTASEMLRSRKPAAEKVHSLCFLSQIAMASGVATAQEIVGDEGIIHQFCHYGATKALKAQVAEIERRTPGYLGED